LKIINLLMLFIFLSLSISHACRCPDADNPLLSFNSMTEVFTGTVASITPRKRINDRDLNDLNITFALIKSYKGKAAKEITVTTASSGIACGYPFETNGQYLVYAYEQDHQLMVSGCGKTKTLKEAKQELQELDSR
jgi:hypothetical protein